MYPRRTLGLNRGTGAGAGLGMICKKGRKRGAYGPLISARQDICPCVAGKVAREALPGIENPLSPSGP